MNLTKHPTIIEAAEASGLDLNDPSAKAVLREGAQFGIEQERDRACGLINLGEETGAQKLALDAVRRGRMMTPELFGQFVQAGRAHIELALRLEDEQLVDGALLNVRVPRRGNSDNTGVGEVLRHLQGLLDTESGAANIEDQDLEVDR